MRIELVAAVARNGVIGKDGALPFRLPDDLARFKRLTLGKPIVMGRKTWASIGGRPLPGRANLVLSRHATELPGATIVRSVDDALRAAGAAESLSVMGGEEVYGAFLPRADCLELTEVDADVEGDTRFPAFDRGAFRVVAEEAHPVDARHALPFRFVTYERR